MPPKRAFPKIEALQQSIATTKGASTPELRQEIINFASDPDHYPIDAIPEALHKYLDKVVRYAYKVTDKDMQALMDKGYTEESIFEITVSAALGASMRRFNKAFEVLKG